MKKYSKMNFNLIFHSHYSLKVYYKGFHGDCSETFHIGTVNDKGRRLVKMARHLLKIGIECCRPGVRFKEIGKSKANSF